MKSEIALSLIFLFLSVKVTTSDDVSSESKKETYSAYDSASWAITSNRLSPKLGLHKQHLYDNYVTACGAALKESQSGADDCTMHDELRMKMNRDQPNSVHNYTKVGYTKTRAPTELYSMIKEFFDNNRHRATTEWKEYNVYHNAWESPPTIISLQKAASEDGSTFTSKIEEAIQPILEEWTGQKLSPVSTYGIRLYHNNSILAPHVDRMPLVTSVIIQVDQDVDEPWPLEVYGHDGTATNVTMEPGDMVLYESHSVIHGRPFPMIGNFFANCFIHFEPYESIEGESFYDPKTDLPPYLKPGSAWENNWRKDNPAGWKGNSKHQELRVAAANGNVSAFRNLILKNPQDMHYGDINGWTVMHEAARTGQVGIVKILLEHGVDKNLLTNTGVSPLNIARQYLEKDHMLIDYFESIGAKNTSPIRAERRHREL